MTEKQRAVLAVEALKKEYPDAICSLTYTEPLQLLIATRLSAQCTDARVNMVTPALFERFPTLNAFCDGPVEDIEEIIRSCGLYKTKARDIYAMCNKLRSDYNGVVPDTVEELTKLPGVGRKTANLVVGDIYHKPAVVTDTHCIRICGRLGLSEGKEPLKVEKQLRAVLPMDEANDFCHRLVLHGRAVCDARKPKCEICCMREFCKYAQETPVAEKKCRTISTQRTMLSTPWIPTGKIISTRRRGKNFPSRIACVVPRAGSCTVAYAISWLTAPSSKRTPSVASTFCTIWRKNATM